MSNKTFVISSSQPARLWYLPAVVIVLAVAAYNIYTWNTAVMLVDSFMRATVSENSNTDLSFQEAGTHTVFLEGQNAQELGQLLHSANITIVLQSQSDGEVIQLRPPDGIQALYHFENRSGREVLEFDIPHPGQYRLTSRRTLASVAAMQTTVAIGHRGAERIHESLLRGLLSMIGGITVATALSIAVAVWRRPEVRKRTLPSEVYAGIGRRIVATLIDILVIIGMGVVIGRATGQPGGGTDNGFSFELMGWPFVVLLVASTTYYVVFEALWAGTLGKLLTGLCVATEDGHDIGWTEAVLRTLFRYVDAFPFVIPYLTAFVTVLATSRRQRLGDLLAGTVVMRR